MLSQTTATMPGVAASPAPQKMHVRDGHMGFTLSAAVELALARHPDISRARAEVGRSRGEVAIAEAAWMPKVGYSSSFGRSTTLASSADGAPLRGGLEVNQLVYDFGRANSQIDAGRATEGQRTAELRDVVERVALTTSEAYLELARAQALLSASDRYVAALVTLRSKIELRAQSGAANQGDIYVAETRIQSAQGERIRARTRLVAAKARLLQLTGKSVALAIEPTRLMEKLAATLGNSGEPGGAGIEAAERAADAARAKLRIAEVGNYPSIGVRAGHTRPVGPSDLSPSSQIGLTISGDLFTGGANEGRMAAARSELEAAMRSAELARLNIATDVAVARAEVDGANQRTDAYRQQLTSAERARATTLAEYEIGRRTLSEVLNTEQEIFRAESDRVNAKGDAHSAIVRAAAARHTLTRSLSPS